MDLIFPGAIYPDQVAGLPWWPLVLVGVALIVINIVNNRVAPQEHYLLWAFVGSVVLLAIGLLDGNDFTDMGLGFSYLSTRPYLGGDLNYCSHTRVSRRSNF